LGGSYWQRASFDAVVVVAAILGLIAFAPAIRRFRPRHWATAFLLTLAVIAFAYGLIVSFRYAGRHLSPIIRRIEQSNPDSRPAARPENNARATWQPAADE
jgi:predicted PurR-regulated permease PerM